MRGECPIRDGLFGLFGRVRGGREAHGSYIYMQSDMNGLYYRQYYPTWRSIREHVRAISNGRLQCAWAARERGEKEISEIIETIEEGA